MICNSRMGLSLHIKKACTSLHAAVGSMFFEGLMTDCTILKAPPHVAKKMQLSSV